MPTTFKVLDATGARLAVKFVNGPQSTVILLNWDGVTDVKDWLSRIDPFPTPAQVPDTQGYVGLSGECLPTPPPAPPPPAPPAMPPPVNASAPPGMEPGAVTSATATVTPPPQATS